MATSNQKTFGTVLGRRLSEVGLTLGDRARHDPRRAGLSILRPPWHRRSAKLRHERGSAMLPNRHCRRPPALALLAVISLGLAGCSSSASGTGASTQKAAKAPRAVRGGTAYFAEQPETDGLAVEELVA